MTEAQVKSLPKTSDTVMVVDDQATSRAILEQVVRSLDERVQVSGFAKPVDALVWATRHVADLVLVDYLMPEMDGIAFVTRLRAVPGYESVPIMMVTVADAREVRYAALDAGITDLLSKPVDVRECMARCRNLLTLRRQQVALVDRQRLLEEMVQKSAREAHAREIEKQTLMQLARGTETRAPQEPREAREAREPREADEAREPAMATEGDGAEFPRMARFSRPFLPGRRMGVFRPRRKTVGRASG